jgi:co-chaperonin GroES (HSP10)
MKPNLNYILIEPKEPIGSSVIITPDTIDKKYIKGKVVEVGDGCYNQKTGEFRPTKCRVGDEVAYVSNIGYLVYDNDRACVLLREEEIFTANGQPINDWIGIKFDENHNRTVNVGGIEIARPETWVYQEFDDKTMYENNKDLKATNPQIATIVNPNSKYGLQKGDLVFVHYLQYTSELIIDGVKYIPFSTIFFKINGKDDFEMADDVYLAKRIIVEAPKTSSGIFLTSTDNKKEPLRLTITHAPRNAKIGVGETIITEDDYQYEIEIYGENYVKITPEWIAATIE